MTGSRGNRKNGQAWIDRKNGSVIRRFTGHGRCSGRIAGKAVVHLYRAVGLHVNYFTFCFKLLEKVRDGAKTIRRYGSPATPCDRLMQHGTVSSQRKEELRECRTRLDPVALSRSVREAQSALAAYPQQSLGKLVPVKAWSGFRPACPACCQQGKSQANT